jgi:hypothetical protein
VADDAKAGASASKSADSLPDAPARDPYWVDDLQGDDRIAYYTARLEWAKAEAAFEAADAKAKAAREKPEADFQALQAGYARTEKVKRGAMAEVASNRAKVQDALDKLKSDEADQPDKIGAQLNALKAAIADFEKAVAAAAAADKDLKTADAAVRKFAEPKPGTPTEKLTLGKDTQAIAETQYAATVATAREPFDKATLAFNDKRAALFAKRKKS